VHIEIVIFIVCSKFRDSVYAGQSSAVSVVPKSTRGRVSDLSVLIHRYFVGMVKKIFKRDGI
jgi:hypothetical protein